ncbi:MAG: hypothetical protein HY360_26755 [Verrucomicrobia bacterium]|nr:hypothetical protein [Verrucomicrobiota bacterium]
MSYLQHLPPAEADFKLRASRGYFPPSLAGLVKEPTSRCLSLGVIILRFFLKGRLLFFAPFGLRLSSGDLFWGLFNE